MEINLAIARLYSKQAQELTSKGKLIAAEKLYQQAIAIEPEDFDNYYLLGLLKSKLGKLELAEAYLKTAQTLAPKIGKISNQLGKICQEQQQTEQAIAHYHQAIALEADNDKFHFNLGEILFKNSDYVSAESSFRQAVEINDQLFWGYYYLGLIKRQQNDSAAALDFFCQCIQLEPYNQQGYYAFQYTPVADEVLSKLITFYQQITAKHPTAYLAWGNLGDLWTQRGQLKQARSCYQTGCYQQVTTNNPHLVELEWQPPKQQPPDFIIVGASKCATSSLFHYLDCHPQILLPHKKELNYFTPANIDLGQEWYYAHFPAIADYPQLITGEASPAYFNSPCARDQISQLSGVKIIILLRNPVDRVISWYYHNLKCGREHRQLSEVIATEIIRIEASAPAQIESSLDYIADSIYVNKIRKWLEIIPADKILILQTEALSRQPAKIMEQVFNFLELPNFEAIEYTQHNRGYYQLTEHSAAIAAMTEFFAPYNQQLAELLTRQFDW